MEQVIHFETLGCRLNQDETEGVARAFSLQNFNCHMESVTAKTEVDSSVILCIINTCTVTGKAEQKARRIIRLMLSKYPESCIIVTGCYAELDAELIRSIDPEHIVCLRGSGKFLLSLLPEALRQGKLYGEGSDFYISVTLLKDFLENRQTKYFAAGQSSLNSDRKLNLFSLYTPVFEKHSRASLKIQDGCNNACTYCRIRLARGKAVSLEPEEVLRRVREQESFGAKEIVLTGVNLSQYAGISGEGKIYSFRDLLEYLLDNTGKVKFRVSSFYPQHITEDLCKVLQNPRVQPFFHLSIQSGSDSILSAMHRPYKVSHVERAVELLREYKDNPFISCDIIAGFPGETDENFSDTVRLCENSKFSWIHAFPFSPRPGTEAYAMKNQVGDGIKTLRAKKLGELAVDGKIQYVRMFEGQTVSAIVEKSRSIRLGTAGENVYHAVTDNFLHAEFRSQKNISQGTVISVKILSVLEENIRSGKEIECSCEIVV